MGYDFSQEKRFPKAITSVLDGFTQAITQKIEAKKPSASNKDALYKQVLATLDSKLKTSSDLKERKILQYVRNHVYIRQQEAKIQK